MQCDFLNIANHRFDSKEKNSILIAMPTLAIECEVHPPLDNELDVYEETVLKFISIEFAIGAIANTLNISETFIEEIFANLETLQFIQKTPGNPWIITEKGEEYLKGSYKDRPSDQAIYGYFFINAIKKDILPFFYNGSLDHASRFQKAKESPLPGKITLMGIEENTFQGVKIKNSDLKEAFSRFVKCNNILKRRDNDEITFEEAKSEMAALDDLDEQFNDLESFDEVDYENSLNEEIPKSSKSIQGHQLVKRLSSPLKEVYLVMQISFDPSIPEGYRVTSPFNLKGLDEKYYLRQVQWLKSQPNVYLEATPLGDYLNKEIIKLCSNFDKRLVPFNNFALAHMPHLHSNKEQFSSIYDSLLYCYGAMQSSLNIREQKHIVRDLGEEVVERLLNVFFGEYNDSKLKQISKIAFEDLKKLGQVELVTNLLSKTFLDRDVMPWNEEFIKTSLSHLTKSHGNGALEKMVNLLIVNYYNPTTNTKSLLEADNASEMFRRGGELNRIRNLASHDKDGRKFEHNHYLMYKENIFTFADGIIAALGRN